ncbi:MAG: tRNA (guanosine(46)-N7)-methyltransferase TrmB [Clostridia bacterium]|nr:tRNA (guanosine(46)-N7)-methyltransferase TrmB [Clostridia bacterium]
MRLRHIPGAAEAVAAHPLVFDEQAALRQKGRWHQAFAADNEAEPAEGLLPLHLEIGMGRGRFLLAAAAADPRINFLGLEKREEIVLQALERIKNKRQPANLRILWLDVCRLPEIFAPGEVEHIYLHFPDPWPKARHAKRRLTAPGFVAVYRAIMAPGGILTLKTDNAPLFAWSQETFAADQWQALRIEESIAQEETGIVSEYEGRYRRQGKPIYLAEWRIK